RRRTRARPASTPSLSSSRLFLPELGVAELLQLLHSTWPVLAEQPRQGAVGQRTTAGLTNGTVVRLSLGIDDALHLCAADRAGLPIATVDGHALAKRGDLLGKTVARLRPQPVDPRLQRGARRLVESLDLAVGQPGGERQRRQP